jgi:hypothetical protein
VYTQAVCGPDLVELLKHLPAEVVLSSLLEQHFPATDPPVHVGQALEVRFRLLALVVSVCLHFLLLFRNACASAAVPNDQATSTRGLRIIMND